MGSILSINISTKKGVPKQEVANAVFLEDFGIVGDAHAGKGIRQVSFLATESINKIKDRINEGLYFGRFAENLTTSGIELYSLKLGTKIQLGNEVIIVITQIGKECHNDCEIKRIAGDCVMPREGVFGKVIVGGSVNKGDTIKIIM